LSELRVVGLLSVVLSPLAYVYPEIDREIQPAYILAENIKELLQEPAG